MQKPDENTEELSGRLITYLRDQLKDPKIAKIFDADGDGMPDEWELARGLDPENPADGPADKNGDGYTNLEDYLNGLITQ